jgi:hypothetical protein
MVMRNAADHRKIREKVPEVRQVLVISTPVLGRDVFPTNETVG